MTGCEECGGALPPDRVLCTTTVLMASDPADDWAEFCSGRCLILWQADILEVSPLRYRALAWATRTVAGR